MIDFTSKMEVKVYYFSTPFHLSLGVSLESTVREATLLFIQAFMQCKESEKSMLKFPNNVEAYELRFLNDDEDFTPDFNFDALNKDRIFSSYNLPSLVNEI